MRILFGIISGLLFLVFCTIFLIILNLNLTLLNPTYAKNLAEKSDLYNKIPQIISENILKEGNVPPEFQDSFVETVSGAIAPQIVKNHLNSLIDQMLSNQVTITENISDIKDVVINNTNLGYVISNSKNNIIPESITFDKRQNNFGRFVLQKNKFIWISFIGTIGFLLILFFVSTSLLKSRFRWVGGFCIPLTIFTLTTFLFFRFIDFAPLINMIKQENSMPQTLDQVIVISNFIKNDFAKLFLYEFIILFITTVILFVVAALIKLPSKVQPKGVKNEANN